MLVAGAGRPSNGLSMRMMGCIGSSSMGMGCGRRRCPLGYKSSSLGVVDIGHGGAVFHHQNGRAGRRVGSSSSNG